MSITITELNNNVAYPINSDALLVPSGYSQYPTAFDSTANDIFKYLKASKFNIDIQTTPNTFTTIELNSNLKRLGKFVVINLALPVFVNLISNFIADNYTSKPSIDDEPIKIEINIEVCDSVSKTVYKNISFEGTAEEFNDVAANIDKIVKS